MADLRVSHLHRAAPWLLVCLDLYVRLLITNQSDLRFVNLTCDDDNLRRSLGPQAFYTFLFIFNLSLIFFQLVFITTSNAIFFNRFSIAIGLTTCYLAKTAGLTAPDPRALFFRIFKTRLWYQLLGQSIPHNQREQTRTWRFHFFLWWDSLRTLFSLINSTHNAILIYYNSISNPVFILVLY